MSQDEKLLGLCMCSLSTGEYTAMAIDVTEQPLRAAGCTVYNSRVEALRFAQKRVDSKTGCLTDVEDFTAYPAM